MSKLCKTSLNVRIFRWWIFRFLSAGALLQFATLLYSTSNNPFITARSPYYPLLAEQFDLGDDDSIAKEQLYYQEQSYVYASQNRTLYVWTALCDERMTSFNGRVALHVFTFLPNKFSSDNSTIEMLRSTWKCKMFYEGGKTVQVPLSSAALNHRNHALFSCFFHRSEYSCPLNVSLIAGNDTKVTNFLEVHRQYRFESPGLTFCGATFAPIPGSGFHNRHQFVEWMEYLKLIGVSQVVIPEPIRSQFFPLPKDLEMAIRFYKRQKFLSTFNCPYIFDGEANINLSRVDEPEKFYRTTSHSKPTYLTFCYLKYGPKHSHIEVGDLDEMPAFNVSKYGNVMAAINAASEKHKKKTGRHLETFLMQDFELFKCNASDERNYTREPVTIEVRNSLGLKSKISTEDVLLNDSRILARSLLASRYSCGKSIHSSKYSFLIWHHWAYYTTARVNFFWENTTTKNESSLYLLMNPDHAQDYPGSLEADTLFYAHARGRWGQLESNRETCSDPSTWKENVWINSVKKELLLRIYHVSQQLDYY